MEANVQEILKGRTQALTRVREVLAKIETAQTRILQLANLQDTMAQHPESVPEKLKKIPFRQLADKLAAEQKVWQNLEKRFSRDKINIGVIGRMRQGKSTLLQTLTGLDNTIIPTMNRTAHTSAQSIIYHTDDKPGARVNYFSKEEFLRLSVWPYHEALSGKIDAELGPLPADFSAFKNLALPAPGDIKTDDELTRIWYERYHTIHSKLNEIERLLGGQSQPIDIADVKKYVTYNKDDSGEHKDYNFLAIKNVEIYETFKNPFSKSIGLTDIPGLGETKQGDDLGMIRAIGEEADFILYIRKADPMGDEWGKIDNQLYATAQGILKNKLPLHKWLFLAINKTEEKALANANLLKEKAQRDLKNLQAHIINCKDEGEVTELVNQVIRYLQDNMRLLDDEVIRNAEQELHTLFQTINREIQGLHINTSEARDNEKYYKLCEDLVVDLRVALSYYRQDVRKHQGDIDPKFKQEISDIIKSAKSKVTILNKTEFDRLKQKENSGRGAYDKLVHDYRSKILTEFHVLSTKPQNTLQEAKIRLADTIVSVSKMHQLSKSNVSILDVLENMAIQADLRDANMVRAIRFIKNFEFSYNGYVQSQIYDIVSSYFPSSVRETHDDTAKKSKDIFDSTVLITRDVQNEQNNPVNTIANIASVLVDINDIVYLPFISENAMYLKAFLSIRNLLNGLSDSLKAKKPKNESEKYVSEISECLQEHEHWMKIDYPESLEGLQKKMGDSLKQCEAQLVKFVGGLPSKTSVTMIEEFIDHFVMPEDIYSEWRVLLAAEKTNLWPELKESVKINAMYKTWNNELTHLQEALA